MRSSICDRMSQATSPGECPECGGSVVQEQRERVCSRCGLVTGTNRIDPGPEWRFGADDADQRRRTGAPLTLARHDRGLSTEIGYTSGADLSDGNPRRLARLRREHSRAQIRSKAERNRVYGFTEIRRLCGTMELPEDIREHACVLFAQAQDEGLFQGRSLEGFAAAAVYAACRIDGIARTREEVTAVSRATASELSVAYDAINRNLPIAIAPTDPREYIPRFASMLDLDSAVERAARAHVAELMEEGLTVGRKPGGVAGGCLYAAATEAEAGVSQREIADVADVSPVTLRGVYKLVDGES